MHPCKVRRAALDTAPLPMSACCRGATEGSRAHPRRAQDRPRQGRSRPVVHRVRAPYDGVVGNLAVQKGDLVSAGQQLAAVVPTDQLYIDANFKETQLAQLVPGEKVADPRRRHGRAIRSSAPSSRLSPASGSVFSLLPAENATGNFTKVVQRVPVRIALPKDALDRRQGGLRAGLSVVIDRRHADDRSRKLRAPSLLPLEGGAALAAERGGRLVAPPHDDSPDRTANTGAKNGRHGSFRGAGLARRIMWLPRTVFAFVVMVFGMFMAILDIQVVSSSLNQIQAGLSAGSFDEIAWVQTAYLIAEVIMIPLSGTLGRVMS